jgi:hypothetical protein
MAWQFHQLLQKERLAHLPGAQQDGNLRSLQVIP